MNSQDPFGFVLEEAHLSRSQEELLRELPLVGESLHTSDSEDHSPAADDRYAPSSPIVMVSLPDSQNDLYSNNTQDMFHTPPEKSVMDFGACSVDRTVQTDTGMIDVDDGCGRYVEGQPAADLSKDSYMGISGMVVTESMDSHWTTEGPLIGCSEMHLERELQLKDNRDDFPDKNLKFIEENLDSTANGKVIAVVDSKGKEVAGAGIVSVSLPTVRDGGEQLVRRSKTGDDRKKNLDSGEEGAQGVRQNTRTRSRELKDFEAAEGAENEIVREATELGRSSNLNQSVDKVCAEDVGRDAMETEVNQTMRMVSMSLKTLLKNTANTKGLDLEIKSSHQKEGIVEVGKLNSNSKLNESTEKVSVANVQKNAAASDHQQLGLLPMPLLKWIENTEKGLNSAKRGSVQLEQETSSLLDLLIGVQGDNDEDDSLEDVSLLEILKRRGVTFPRPRWWPDELYKKSKLFN